MRELRRYIIWINPLGLHSAKSSRKCWKCGVSLGGGPKAMHEIAVHEIETYMNKDGSRKKSCGKDGVYERFYCMKCAKNLNIVDDHYNLIDPNNGEETPVKIYEYSEEPYEKEELLEMIRPMITLDDVFNLLLSKLEEEDHMMKVTSAVTGNKWPDQVLEIHARFVNPDDLDEKILNDPMFNKVFGNLNKKEG